MRIKRLIILSVSLIVSLTMFSQEADTTRYYDHALTPTGKVYNEVDTAYNVTLILDMMEMSSYVELQFATATTRNTLQVSPRDLKTLSEVSLKQDKYHLEIGEWYGPQAFLVTGTDQDGNTFELHSREKAKMHIHQVISDTTQRWNLTFSKEEPIVEPKPFVEPEPVEPDTTGVRPK